MSFLTIKAPMGVIFKLSGFGDASLGTRQFDYDFDPSRLTTHTPDVERITANAGIVGATLTGAPSNLEPRYVTEDGVPAMFAPGGGGDADGQGLVSSAAASTYAFLHTAAFKSIYVLTKPGANAAGDDIVIATVPGGGAGFMIYRSSGQGVIHARVINDAGTIILDLTSPAGLADDSPALIGVHRDASQWHISINGAVVNSGAASGSHGTGSPGKTLHVGRYGSVTSNVYSGHIWRVPAYTGVDHLQSGILRQFYALVKTTYPTLGLP